MARGLLIGSDEAVADWLFTVYKLPRIRYDCALGVVDDQKVLVGAVMFHYWNGTNVELSYFGANTISPGIIRSLAKFTLFRFDPARLTVTISARRRQFLRAVQKIGFKPEGVQRCYYGKRDCRRNTAHRFVMFRDQIEKLARLHAS